MARRNDKYQYDGCIYCDTDLSMEIGDDYAGDLYDLYWELKERREVGETKFYTHRETLNTYEDWEDLLREEYGHLIVGSEEPDV